MLLFWFHFNVIFWFYISSLIYPPIYLFILSCGGVRHVSVYKVHIGLSTKKNYLQLNQETCSISCQLLC